MTSTKYSWFCTKLKYNGLSVVPLCLPFMWLQWVYCPGSWIVLIYHQLCRHFCCCLLQISLARKFQISLLFWHRHCTTSPQAHLTFAPVSLCLASFHGAFSEAATHRTPDVDVPPRKVQPRGRSLWLCLVRHALCEWALWQDWAPLVPPVTSVVMHMVLTRCPSLSCFSNHRTLTSLVPLPSKLSAQKTEEMPSY